MLGTNILSRSDAQERDDCREWNECRVWDVNDKNVVNVRLLDYSNDS